MLSHDGEWYATCLTVNNKQKFPLTVKLRWVEIKPSKYKFYEADRVIIVTTPSSKLNWIAQSPFEA